MNFENDLRILAEQEELLRFESFDESTAEALVRTAVEQAGGKDLSVTALVRIAGSPVYLSAMPGTTPSNFYWATRKANLVELYGQSSYRLGLSAKQSGKDILEEAGLNPSNYAAHGGSFPIRLTNGLLIGSFTVSGLPQRVDHNVAASALAALLKINVEQLD